MDILYETDNFNNCIIQPANKCINLIDSAKLIFGFNEASQLGGDRQNRKIKVEQYKIKN